MSNLHCHYVVVHEAAVAYGEIVSLLCGAYCNSGFIRLEHSHSIIYAESPNANKSNWMPWEIGVVDGRKEISFALSYNSPIWSESSD